jgi:hypothetical protein
VAALIAGLSDTTIAVEQAEAALPAVEMPAS